MRKLIILFILLAALAGCSRAGVPIKSESDHRSSERITDTVTRIVPDSAMISALLECDSLGRVSIRELTTENGRLIRQNLSLRDNLLQVQAKGESQERVREIIRTDTVYVRQEVPVAVTETKTVTINRLHWWQKWLVWLGIFYLARLALKLAFNWRSITFKNLLKLF